jgi:hypothetical protein
VISFRLQRKGTIVLVIRDADCSVVGRRSYRGHAGLNRVRFDGRVRGRPLRPGRYSIVLVVVRGASREQVGAIAVEVVQPGRRLSKQQRSAPLGPSCLQSSTAAPLLAPVLSTTPGTRVGAFDLVRGEKKNPSRSGVLGASLEPPRLAVPVVHDAPFWLAVLLVTVFVLSVAGLAVYVTRYPGGSSNP